MVEERFRKHFDFILLFTVLLITVFGAILVLSAAHTDAAGSKFLQKQIIWAVMGLVVMIILANSDYRILRKFSRPIYAGNLFLLLVVMFMGHSSKGSQRWISLGFFDLQPSEIAKISLIITLANYLLMNQRLIKEPGVFFKSLLHVSIPAVLILKQPDLGTSLVLIAMWAGMIFIAGAKKRYMVIFIVVGALLFGMMWHFNVLKPYQKSRVTSFIDPASDPRATGWHVQQSLVAIGSGKITGKGLFKGSQNRLHFIPEQHTDFIFTVTGEELGFMGSLLTLALYFVFLWRILRIMAECEDRFGQLVSAGIFSVFAFHVLENLGMTLGIMPVAGVPLPFMSYGGSSMLVNMSLVGILESIHLRRHKIMF